MKRTALFLLAIALLSFSGKQDFKYIGPEKGYLVIAGAQSDKPLLEKFMQLVGDTGASIVIITTAGEEERQNEKTYTILKKQFADAGIKHTVILHTRDTAAANSEKFLQPIREAKGVWFTGGRQWRLADAYLGTKVVSELNKLLDRGGVIGGNSAGATIQGSFLVRGDTKTPAIMDGDHKKGFGFLKNSAIDQHLLVRNRQFDLLEVRKKYPELLGIGIDEETAIVVHRNEFEVIGNKYVAVYDGTMIQNGSIIKLSASDNRFYFLKAGDKYDLNKRQPLNLTER